MAGETNTPKKAGGAGPVIAAVIFVVVLFGGVYLIFFGGSPGTAKKRFSESFVCPADRIELRERKDIKGSMFLSHPPPSPEIKNDPARLQIFMKKQAEQDADADSGGNYGVFFYEVRGCGHEQLYECSNKPRCTERKYPAGVKPSW